MILNGEMALTLRYFTELGSFRSALHKSGRRYTYSFCDRNVAQSIWFFARAALELSARVLLAIIACLCVCVCVCHTPVLYQNG